jgi:hypothetical protein
MDSHNALAPAGPDDPLAFTPVPRARNRADGWTPERQKSFIHILSLCGSIRRAAGAVGKAANGVEQLRAAPGGDSFSRACDAAIALFQAEEARRCEVAASRMQAEAAAWQPPPGPFAGAASRRRALPPPPEPEEPDTPEAHQAFFEEVIRRYLIKVGQEREARLAGEVVAADFYLRQLTWLEVVLDLTSEDALKVLRDFRAEHDLVQIAETPMSKILGEARRIKWAEMGEPERPEHPPRRYLEHHGRYSTEPQESTRGGGTPTHAEQQRLFEERHRQDAADQIAWEDEQRRAYDRRRESAAGS